MINPFVYFGYMLSEFVVFLSRPITFTEGVIASIFDIMIASAVVSIFCFVVRSIFGFVGGSGGSDSNDNTKE